MFERESKLNKSNIENIKNEIPKSAWPDEEIGHPLIVFNPTEARW